MSKTKSIADLDMSGAMTVYNECLERHIHALRVLAYKRLRCSTFLCESPIEVRLMAALMWLGPSAYGTGATPAADFRAQLIITPQVTIGKYRVDFTITSTTDAFLDCDDIKIVIECDGHAFHEKTKEQASRDKARDRFLLSLGWRVVRFTGSEIFSDANGCAKQIERLVLSIINTNYAKEMRRPAGPRPL